MTEHDKAAAKPEADEAAPKPTVYGRATYRARKGEVKTVEMDGMVFNDGKPTDVTNAALLETLQHNALYECDPKEGTLQDQQHPQAQPQAPQHQPQHTTRR